MKEGQCHYAQVTIIEKKKNFLHVSVQRLIHVEQMVRQQVRQLKTNKYNPPRHCQ